MPKYVLEITERADFRYTVEADDLLDALSKGKDKFMDSGPVIHEGDTFLSDKCVLTAVTYHFEAEEQKGKTDEAF